MVHCPKENNVRNQVAQSPPWPFDSIGRPDEVLEPKGVFQEISKLLGQVGQNEDTRPSVGLAIQLPHLPGLTVRDFGGVSLPLREEQAKPLIGQCLTEANSVWTLLPQQVEMKNPQWEKGIRQLSEMNAGLLGFKDVALQPVLSKVVIIGPGGWVRGGQSVEYERAVAKLVVQLPSEYTGGDLVLFNEEAKEDFCYEFCNVNGLAPFEPLFAAFSAGTFHAVEQVTSGYRLVMEYWLCLPVEIPIVPVKRLSDVLLVRLAEAMKKLREDDAMLRVLTEVATGNVVDYGDEAKVALLLSKSCKTVDIESRGAQALSGMDRDCFQFICKANSRLLPGEQLKFYIVHLHYRSLDNYNICDEKLPSESASWYTINGEKLCDGTLIKWTRRFSFLNPRNETLGQLFQNNPCCSDYVFERYAIVGWPAVADIANTYHLMGEFAASTSVLADIPVNVMKLRMVNNFASEYQFRLKRNPRLEILASVSLVFCQNFCKTTIELSDSRLAAVFLRQYFPRLDKKDELIPLLAVLVDKIGWKATSFSLVSVICGLRRDTGMGLSLKLADALTYCPNAQLSLIRFAWVNAREMRPNCLSSDRHLGLLCKLTTVDTQVFQKVFNIFERMNAKLLGSVVDALSKCTDESSLAEHRAALVCLASRRRKWLDSEITTMEEPFAWKITTADFPDVDEVTTFLDGPDLDFVIQGFTGIIDARRRVALLNSKIEAPLSITAGGRGKNAYVKIVKSGGGFANQTSELADYKAEMDNLDNLLAIGEKTVVWKKRPREEVADIATSKSKRLS